MSDPRPLAAPSPQPDRHVPDRHVPNRAGSDRSVRIGAREAQQLIARFVTRASAVFYARLAFLALGFLILAIPSWRTRMDVSATAATGFFTLYAVSAVVAYALSSHPRHGRWVMFATLNLDLLFLLYIIAKTGGLASPVMAAQLLFTVFFALLFPNPVAIIPPLLMLPLVTRVSQVVGGRPDLSTELLFLLWYASLNGVAVYVMVYLTGREEQQSREILQLERELKKMAVVEERNRLARDIHDGLGASLSGLIIQSEYALTLARGNDELQTEIKELKGGAEEAIDEVRRALSMMRDEFDLLPQLHNTCTTFTTRHKLPVELHIDGEPPPLSDEQSLTVFRIMQECLTNVAKHAEATVVRVDVQCAPASMHLTIVDDGRGFDPTKTPRNHYGLINMRERARKVHGTVSIESEPGAGTRVALSLSVGERNPGALAASAGASAG